MTDEEIAIEHIALFAAWNERHQLEVLAALAAARREQHAECVRLLHTLEDSDSCLRDENGIYAQALIDAVKALESHKP